MADAKWFIAHTYAGYEKKVRDNILATVATRGMEDQILEVITPEHTVIETKKNGEKKTVERLMYPCYAFVRMIMNEETWYVVRNTRGVTGFVGPGSKPVPLSDEEVARMGIGVTEIINTNFEEGRTVSIIGGAWANTTGVIKSVNPSKQMLTINVEMFGRETPVEIGFGDVKVDE